MFEDRARAGCLQPYGVLACGDPHERELERAGCPHIPQPITNAYDPSKGAAGDCLGASRCKLHNLLFRTAGS